MMSLSVAASAPLMDERPPPYADVISNERSQQNACTTGACSQSVGYDEERLNSTVLQRFRSNISQIRPIWIEICVLVAFLTVTVIFLAVLQFDSAFRLFHVRTIAVFYHVLL